MKLLLKIWNRMCDASDLAEDFDSLVRARVVSPVKEFVFEFREQRRLAKMGHWSY